MDRFHYRRNDLILTVKTLSNDICLHKPTICCVALPGVNVDSTGAPLPFFGSFILRRGSPSSIFIFVFVASFVLPKECGFFVVFVFVLIPAVIFSEGA